MDITVYISRFLYRIRYQLLFGSMLVTLLVAYFTQFLPKTYTVSTSIYTGIVSSSGLSEDNKTSYFEQNSTFNNIINLTKSKGTLEKVSLKLFALNMMYGNPNADNKYIMAKNYRALLKIVPESVHKLIDKKSFENTVRNLEKYRTEEPDNFLYGLFSYDAAFYSYNALKTVIVRRINNSDLIEISYKSSDPGISLSTVKLLSEELSNAYNNLRFKTVNDIVKYYEEQLRILQARLTKQEDELTNYNVKNNVINYLEQTKAIAISRTNYEDRCEAIRREYESSSNLVKQLEQRMETRAKLFRANTEFIDALSDITTINGKITEIQNFSTEEAQANDPDLKEYQQKLKETEKKIGAISNDINEYKYSTEGVAIDDMVSQWLDAVIRSTKAEAELKVLEKREKDYEEQYKVFSPVGTQIHRKEREIKFTEESYLEVLHGLNLAKLKQKDLELTSSNLNTITAPTFPLMNDNRKRALLVIAAFIGSLIFILGYYMVQELLDRTLRDAERTHRLTRTNILGAFTGNVQLRYRGYIKACNRISASYACNRLTPYLRKGETTCVNLLSIEKGEGKTFIANYFKEYWEERGLRVSYFEVEKEILENPSFLLSTDFKELIECHQHPDILLIEQAYAQSHMIPSALIGKADVNLLVANAQRVWKNSDDELLGFLKELSGETPFYIYLNNASRFAVEDFTGQLPPKSSVSTIAYRMRYLGFTARKDNVK